MGFDCLTSLFVILSSLIWPLSCLSFFDLQLLLPLYYLQTFLSTRYQLYCPNELCWTKKSEYPEKATAWETLSITSTNVHIALIVIDENWTHNLSGDNHWYYICIWKSSYNVIVARLSKYSDIAMLTTIIAKQSVGPSNELH